MEIGVSSSACILWFSVKWGFSFYVVAVSGFVWGLRESQNYTATPATLPECCPGIWGLSATSFKPSTLFTHFMNDGHVFPTPQFRRMNCFLCIPVRRHCRYTIQLQVVVCFRSTSDVTNRQSFLGRVDSTEPSEKKEWERRAIWEICWAYCKNQKTGLPLMTWNPELLFAPDLWIHICLYGIWYNKCNVPLPSNMLKSSWPIKLMQLSAKLWRISSSIWFWCCQEMRDFTYQWIHPSPPRLAPWSKVLVNPLAVLSALIPPLLAAYCGDSVQPPLPPPTPAKITNQVTAPHFKLFYDFTAFRKRKTS